MALRDMFISIGYAINPKACLKPISGPTPLGTTFAAPKRRGSRWGRDSGSWRNCHGQRGEVAHKAEGWLMVEVNQQRVEGFSAQLKSIVNPCRHLRQRLAS